MAPDLDALAKFRTDGYKGLKEPGGDAYEIPDIQPYSPLARKIRVLSIGAGVTGILNAYNIQKHCQNVDHVIYDKNDDIGGTWLENRYPGKCQVSSSPGDKESK